MTVIIIIIIIIIITTIIIIITIIYKSVKIYVNHFPRPITISIQEENKLRRLYRQRKIVNGNVEISQRNNNTIQYPSPCHARRQLILLTSGRKNINSISSITYNIHNKLSFTVNILKINLHAMLITSL